MKKWILSLFVLAFGISQSQTYYQQKAVYTMDIEVDASRYTYTGKQTLIYTNNSPDTLSEVYYHLYWNAFHPGSLMDQRVQNQGKDADRRLMTMKDGQPISRLSLIPKEQEGRQNIHWIAQEGIPLTSEIQETVMKVPLAKPLKPGQSTTLTMEWDAVIPQQIRRAGRQNREGIEMTMTQWFPKIAEYDRDGWASFDYLGREFHSTFSDYTVNIAIDPSYIIGAGGSLLNPNEVKGYHSSAKVKTNAKGLAVWKWKADNILDFAWAADPDYTVESFTADSGLPVYFVYQKNKKTRNWELAKPYIKKYFALMNEKFGEYKYPSYSFVQGGDGGMEYGMTTMILGEGEKLEGLVGLMAHEGAHSWFQQMLATNESMYPWMDEGFTTYAEDYTMGILFPDEHRKHHWIDTLDGYRKFILSGKEEPAHWLADHHDFGTAYSVASYTKGATYLVQLNYLMGAKTMDRVMKEYYNQWALKHPTPRDFFHIAQRISGLDLKVFNHYWIGTTEKIDYGIQRLDFQNNQNIIGLKRFGKIPMPITLKVSFKNGSEKEFYIPQNLFRTLPKEITNGKTILPNWDWTSADYSLHLPYGTPEIAKIEIDPSGMLADTNLANNTFIP